MLLHEIFEYNATKYSDQNAFVSESNRHTWKEANDLADHIASFLYESGVRAGDRVGALSRNSTELIAILVASSKIGAIYAPINYRLSTVETAKVLEDADPSVLFVHDEFAQDENVRRMLASLGLRTVEFNANTWNPSWRPTPPEMAPWARSERGSENDPLWICYTGGSTGDPKGVVLTHRNMMATGFNLAVANGIVPDDTYLLAGPMYHVVLAVPVGHWIVGARTVIINFEAAKALEFMEREHVTRMVATGTIFKMLIDEMSQRPRAGLCLRNIDFGGAPIPIETALRAAEVFSCTVGQIYGQSETSCVSTYLSPLEYGAAVANPDDADAWRHLASVGRAGALLVTGVMDAHGNLIDEPGEVGEIVVKGDSIMHGYWNKPDLDRQVIVNGWLRTGDLGKRDSDGYVYLVDRVKDMIITGGENVYSAEVEKVLMEHPDVDQAIVLGRPDAHWGETVHAVVVPVPGRKPTPEALASFCRGHLAGYKIPRSFDFRDAVPSLATGKIQKHLLRDSITL